MLFLYFLGLNLSTRKIAHELNLNKDDAQHMAEVLHSGVVEKKQKVAFSGVVECDEEYVVAGHKGQPEAIKKGPGRTTQSVKRGACSGYAGEGKNAGAGHD